jgi:glycosyltransferase involved in cell wall biosynthesis
VTRPLGLVCGTWPPARCGIGDFSASLANALAEIGRDVVVVTSTGVNADSNPKVRVLPAIDSWRPASVWRILRLLHANGCEVLNLEYPTQRYGRLSAVDLIPALARLHGLRAVTTIHEYGSYRAAGRWRVRTMVRASNAAIVTEADNLHALERAGLKTKLHHVPLAPTIEPVALAASERDALRAARGTPADSDVFAYFGLISPGKGLDTLLDALDMIPTEAPLRVWVLAGREAVEPAYRAAFDQVAPQLERLEREGRIYWSGDLSAADLSRHLSAADVAVLPYRDGASLRRTTLLAALAHGLPVISCGEKAPCGGIELVPPGDARALAEAMLRLSADGTRRRQLADDALAAAADFRWPEVARRTAEVMDAVCKAGAA